MGRLVKSMAVLALFALAGCSGTHSPYEFDTYTPCDPKFAKRAYNKPYEIKGETYYPQTNYEYSQVGMASYYGGRDIFHGRKTSTGEVFDKNLLTAAHKTLPIPSVVVVTNLKNGRSLKLKVHDRGPFVAGRIVDVSEKAAKMLGFYNEGTAQVRVDVALSDTLELVKKSPLAVPKTMLAKHQQKQKKSGKTILASASGHRARQTKQGFVDLPPLKTVSYAPHQKRLQGSAPPQKSFFIQTRAHKQLSNLKGVASHLKKLHPNLPLKVQQNKAKPGGDYRLVVGPLKSDQLVNTVLKKIHHLGEKGQVFSQVN